MFFIKFQVSCLAVILLISAIYIIQSKKKNLKCNHFFDAFLINCPLVVIFDGLTSWTVNNQDLVPLTLNLILHLFFYIFIDSTVFCAFLYMCNETVGFPKSMLKRIFIFLPFIISLIIISVFLKNVEFIQGIRTNYSMGISVYACFVTILLYFSLLLMITLIHRQKIEKIKQIGIIVSLFFTLSILVLQIIFPEILLSALAPVCLLLSFYMILENPASKILENTNHEVISAFSTLVEERDNSTGGHIRRTKEYVRIILEELQKEKLHKKEITKDFVKNMLHSAPMHDIGKISTPDEILKASRKLTPEEFAVMKKHAEKGGEIIKHTFAALNEIEFLNMAFLVARHHHEKWNGKGYPDGLKEKEIPLCARIMAVADVFDAVSAKRCYREALPLENCFKIISEGRGTDFDPEIVDVFFSAKSKVIEVYRANQ